MSLAAKIISVGTAVPPKSFTQQDILDRMKITDDRIINLFTATRIKKRHLFLSEELEVINESQDALLQKHLNGALDIGTNAIAAALQDAGITINEVDFICVVSSTGFLLPALSAYFIKTLGIRDNCQRVDIVGMGCNAGLNGLNTVRNWTLANPGRNALMICVEICSAIYVNDGSLGAHVVNSLFGDGAGALVVRAEPDTSSLKPKILGFKSQIITDAIDSMRYNWDIDANKFSFHLHHANPFLVGRYIKAPVDALLEHFHLRIPDISHWIVHGGGRNVISAVKINLGISSHDMRHTTSVLQDYGNVSSASFLFSYSRLLNENIIKAGDYGVCITIGPGAQLETALLQW